MGAIEPTVRGNTAYAVPPLTFQSVIDSLDTPAADESALAHGAAVDRDGPSEQLLRRLVATSDLLYSVHEPSGEIVESNPAWKQLLGHTADTLAGFDTWQLVHPDELHRRSHVERELAVHGYSQPRLRMRTATGTYRQIQWTLQVDEGLGRCLAVGRGVAEPVGADADPAWRDSHDELTGLARRARLRERLNEVLDVGGSPTVLFCDIDRFKIINDSLGHEAGDDILIKFARRLTSLDLGTGSLVSRFGGDQFIVMLDDGGEAHARLVAARLQSCSERPFEIGERSVHLTMSIGICCASGGVQTPDKLVDAARRATDEAKALGRKRCIVFDDQIREEDDRRFDIESRLRRGFERGEIVAHFQPIVSIPNGEIIGAEALVRWQTPDRLVLPGEFLDVAADAGLLPRVGRVVIAAAVATAERLATIGETIQMSINVSDAELETPGFCTDLLDCVDRAGLDPSNFMIEVSESAMLATEPAIKVLTSLRSAGFRIALDDFGTGFSSLAHLRELPIDAVKVDRSFVADLLDDTATRVVTTSLIELCQALGLDVIVQGIETTQQSAAVEQLGATRAQGFLFHHAMEERELTELVRQGRSSS